MIELESFGLEHLAATFQWMQNESLKRDFMFSAVVTLESHQSWYENYCRDNSQKIWAIKADGNHVGNMGLKNIDFRNRKAEGWIYVGSNEMRGKHVGSSSWKYLFEDTGFIQLGLHKIYTHVAEWNIASKKMVLNAGFNQEGILQQEMFFDNDYVTLYRFGKLLDKYW